MNTSAARAYFTELQERIVARLEAIDGKPFRRDEWTRAEGGGGISRIIEDGNVFERGGVNFSHVPAPACRRPRRRRTRESRDGRGKRRASRSCCIRAIRTRPPCTST